MINTKVYLEEVTMLVEWFKKEPHEGFIKQFKDLLDDELTTQEFQKACRNAKRDLNPHPSYFPSPKFLIESVHGAIADRALLEWMDTTRLSAVGRKAFEEIGGAWAKQASDRPELLKKDFVAAYTAIAKQSEPQDLRRQVPKVALPSVSDAPTIQEPPTEFSGDSTLLRLQTKLKLGLLVGNKSMQDEAIAEAKQHGYDYSNGEIRDAARGC